MQRRSLLKLALGSSVAAAMPSITAMAAGSKSGAVTQVGGAALALTERGSVLPTRGKVKDIPLPINDGAGAMRYKTPYRFGLGGTQVGNIFAPISDEQAHAVIAAAWDAGVRYFDTSPFYGFGLSEYRMGRFLHNQHPDDYIISTKVGRVLTAAGKPVGDQAIWTSPAPFNYRYDYTAAGARRSVEDSLQRLGLPRIDIAFIHDLSPDNAELENWEDTYEIARTGAMVELEKMRKEGLIKAWGFGINTPNAAVKTVQGAGPVPDIVLLACQYTLVDHEQALNHTLPALQKAGTSVVVGTPLNDGFLGGRNRYNFTPNLPAAAVEKRARISVVADQYGIDLRTAALQFAAAHPIVSAIIPGSRVSEQVLSNVQSMKVDIPAEFWSTLKQQGLIAQHAPTPV